MAPLISLPIGVNGDNNCNLSDSSLTTTFTWLPSLSGAKYPLSFTSNPFGGNSHPVGSSNITFSPLAFINESVSGLKSRRPAIAIAAVISGEATKACVLGFPSALFAKFLLNEWTILFLGAFFGSLYLAHWPIHGPQAFVNIFASSFSKIDRIPSLSAV